MGDSLLLSIFDSRDLFQYCIGRYLSLNDMVSLGQVDHLFHARVKRFFPQVALGNVLNRLYPMGPGILARDSCYGWVREVIAHGQGDEVKLFLFHWIMEYLVEGYRVASSFSTEYCITTIYNFAILENARNGNISFHTLLLSSFRTSKLFDDSEEYRERLLADSTVSAALEAVLAKRFDFAVILLSDTFLDRHCAYLCQSLAFEKILKHAIAWRLDSVLNQLTRIHNVQNMCETGMCSYCKWYPLQHIGLYGSIVDLCNVPNHDYIEDFWRNKNPERTGLRGAMEMALELGHHYQASQIESFLKVPLDVSDWTFMYRRCKQRLRKRHAQLYKDLDERIDPEEYNTHVETLKWLKRRRDNAKEKDEAKKRQMAEDYIKAQVIGIFNNKRARFD